MELFTALGLSSAPGLNAYIPMLVFGLLARFTSVITLPQAWQWLSDPILLGIVAVLLVIEIVADKVPAVDTINDAIQTVIRPTSGGLMFASGLNSATGENGVEQLTTSEAFRQPSTWIALVVGFAVALGIHFFKSSSRPVWNASTVGLAAPVVSTGEDAVAAALSFSAVLVPVVALLLVAALVGLIIWFFVKVRKRFARSSSVARVD